MLYRHYKGGLYRTLFEDSKHSESQEEMVVYMSVETGKVWVRPAGMFFEMVATAKGWVPRFSEVHEKRRTANDRAGETSYERR
jgi:hypothetical protein